jgi:hypothetical protein
MAAQDVDLELKVDGVFTAVPLHATPVTITRGSEAYGSFPHPARIQCEIDDDTLSYDPTRPASLLYGVAGRNTEVRIRPVGVEPSNLAWFYAEATAWDPDATPDHVPGERGRASVTLVAEGLQRRIGKWRDRLGSPLRRAVLLAIRSGAYDAAEYWPMEDPGGSGTAVSAIGGPPMEPVVAIRYTLPDGSILPPGGAPRFADGRGVLGSDPLVSFQGGGTLRGAVRDGTWNGYTIDWVAQMPAGIGIGETASLISWSETGTYVYYEVSVAKGSPSSIGVYFANATDRLTFSSTGSASGAAELWDGTPHFFRFQVRQSGGNYLARLYIDGFLFVTGEAFATPGAMPGTVGRPYNVEWNRLEQSGAPMPIAAGHTIVWRSGQDGGQPSLTAAFNGHRGERGQVRFDRVFEDESGLQAYFSSGAEFMGPQSSDPMLKQLQLIEATDGGRIDDWRFEIANYFRTRRSLHAKTSTLDLTREQLTPPFRKKIDDLGIANLVTVRNWDGEEVTVRRDTGPTSTLPPPDGVGEYPLTVDVNLNDRLRLPHHANWRLARGGYEIGQYREVTVDLVANPDLRTAVQAVLEGDHITVSGVEPEVLHFMVVGIVARITSGTHTVTFRVEPWGVWDVGVWDSPTWRWDVGTMTLDAAYSETAGNWVFAFTNPRDVFTSNCDLLVGGERVTMTAHGALTGSGPYTQTATVTRAVNGVRKAQRAGTEVHVADARRWGL